MRSSMKETITDDNMADLAIVSDSAVEEDLFGTAASTMSSVTTRSKSSASGKSRSPRSSSIRRDRAQQRANRTFVKHDYVDHLHDPMAPQVLEQYNASKKKSLSLARSGSNMAFPDKLYNMLASAQVEYADIVSWQPHGRCFLIHKKDQFVNEIMPRFFQQTKLTSFQRQLNLYGFIRLTAGQDRGSYYHPLFLRGRPDLCCFMVRTRVKGNGMKAASSPETEPNFYSMEFCYDRYRGNQEEEKSVSEKSVASEPASPVASSSVHPGVEKESAPESATEPEISIPDPEHSSKMGFNLCNPALIQPRVISPPPITTLFSAAKQNMSQYFEATLAPLNPLSSAALPEPPTTGDEIFFEGLKFHYLDHMDLDNVDDLLSDSVAM